MCMVSNIGDQWGKDFPDKWPHFPQFPQPSPHVDWGPFVSDVSRAEFEALKREVEELKKLLQAAKKFDEATGQPHCEMDAKVALIKAVAKAVGVDMGDVFDQSKPKK
jgi:hypothetical protein